MTVPSYCSSLYRCQKYLYLLYFGFNNHKYVYTYTAILSKQSIADLDDFNLKFVEHVNTVCSKALKFINILFKCFLCLNVNAYCQAYICNVRPLREYEVVY